MNGIHESHQRAVGPSDIAALQEMLKNPAPYVKAWWSRGRAVKCARQVFALDGQNADLPCPGALKAEGLRLELSEVLA